MNATDPIMKPNPHPEEALFQAAAQLAGAERNAFLNGACHGNAVLRQRLETLLAAHAAGDSFLEPEDRKPDRKPVKTMKLEIVDVPDEAVGQTLGRYKLLERVGEGGCGVVYVAEQTEPVRRRVALKVIKLGMDTKQVVARFEAERQALAMMDHPNIAKVLDAGTTDVGRPFFVMELVRGIRITDYCDQANLTTKERLDLFIKVCQAIQHAHQKGIIHRDIKPSNILVTLHDGVPVPKVIDFGIAKATEGRLTDATVYTQLHQFIGTPAYMSPEQAEMSGLDIDTRSDIYSLGVLLYELLAGSTPFDAKELMASGIDVMRKTIRENEPQRPSTRLATLGADQLTTTAKRRSADTSKLLHQLKGDLDWIVMKCLEKDRQRRYETANGIAADIKRHLNNEPIVARPPSTAYRFQKAFRRNKVAFAAGAAVFAVLVVGMIGTSMGMMRAERQRRVADQAQQQARANFDQARAAVREMLTVAGDDLYNKPGMQAVRVKLLRTAIEHYQTFLQQASTDPALRAELGRLYIDYGFAALDSGEDYSQNYTNVVLPAFDSGIALLRQLVKEQPDNRSFRDDLGWGLVFARLWHDPTGVETNQPEAVAIFDGLIRADGKDPFARWGLAWALGINIDRHNPNSPEKQARSQRRLAILEQLVKEYPRSAVFRRDLANQLSFMTRQRDADDEQTLNWISRANNLRSEVLTELKNGDPAVLAPLPKPDSVHRILRPSALYATFDLANGLQLQAAVLRRLKQWNEALSCLDQSIALWGDLAEQNPSVTRFAEFLDGTFTAAVRVLEEAGDPAGAEARRQAAKDFWRTHPQVRRQNR